MKTAKFLQIIMVLSAALFGSACILETFALNPTAQIIVVTADPGGAVPGSTAEVPAVPPSPTLEWTQTLTLTFTPSITSTFTKEPVTMTAGQRLSCVKGPHYILYEWVTAIEMGDTVVLTARSTPEWPDYYYARKTDGTECWAFGASSTITGDASSLPVMEAPPLPTVTFVITNKVIITLCEVLIRGKDETAWGANRISSHIDIDGAFSLTLTSGYYDVKITDCMFGVMYEEHNRPIAPDPAYRLLVVAPEVDFYIQNNYPFSICWIEVRPAGGSWRYLYNTATDGGSIAIGGRKDFTLRGGMYTLRATRCTSVVLPLASLHVRLGMGGVTWA